ncbi:hypothetical protein CRG98_001412 [Punica granatum]|uniref:Uncharacterized protein n=1 Tax=Punica granatum TaxID=22663 RepID=A0A2I0LC44_PUNGR|nr:hypothetical protein CRG98_001412 [Punica granatum]
MGCFISKDGCRLNEESETQEKTDINVVPKAAAPSLPRRKARTSYDPPYSSGSGGTRNGDLILMQPATTAGSMSTVECGRAGHGGHGGGGCDGGGCGGGGGGCGCGCGGG